MTSSGFVRMAVLAATLCWLAHLANQVLTPWFASRGHGVDAVELEVVDGAPGTGTVELRRVMVRGKTLRYEGDSAAIQSGWKVQPDFGDGTTKLIHSHGGGPSIVRFSGDVFSAAFASAGWKGEIRVRRNGAQTQQVPLREGEFVLIDDPDPQVQWWGLALALALLLPFAIWLGPIRESRTVVPWLLFFLSAYHLLYWASHSVGTTNDSPGYVNQWEDLLAGVPSYFPPGYPAFLGVLRVPFGSHLGLGATFLQHAMMVIMAYWVYRLLEELLTSGNLAFVGALLVGVSDSVTVMAQGIISESPTTFAMVGALYFAVRLRDTSRFAYAWIAGFFIAWATMLRIAPVVALVPACLLLQQRGRWRVDGGRMLAVAGGLLLLLMGWQGLRSGDPRLTDSSGLHLYNRVVMEQKLTDPKGPATKRVSQQVPDYMNVGWWDVVDRLQPVESSELERKKLVVAMAWEGIRAQPLSYLLFTPVQAWRIFITPPGGIPQAAHTVGPMPRVENRTPLPVGRASLTWTATVGNLQAKVWPLLCWIALAGLVIGITGRGRSLLVLGAAWVILVNVMASAAVELFSDRYNVVDVPFVIVLALIPLDRLIVLFSKSRKLSTAC